MVGLAPILIAGGGIAYVATRPPADVPAPGATVQVAPSSGSTLVQQIAPVPVSATPPARRVYRGNVRSVGIVAAFGTASATSYGGSTVDPSERQKLDAIEAAAEAAYSKLDAAAKAAAAKKLNDALKLDPPLKGNEDWATVAAVVGGAAGAAAGVAICGPICGKIGALAGAYLGEKLEDLMARNWDDLKSWLSSQWGSIEDAAEDAYDYVAGILSF